MKNLSIINTNDQQRNAWTSIQNFNMVINNKKETQPSEKL